MHLIIIANPFSGGGKGKKQFDCLVNYCLKNNIIFSTYLTQYAGEMIKMIPRIIQNLSSEQKIIIIGGDGTLNEAISALIQFNQEIPVAYLPAGTGNDFAREMKLTHDIPTFIKHLQNETIKNLEIISYHEKMSHKKGIAINSLGFGIDADICQLNTFQTKSQKKRFGLNKLSYLTPIIDAFKRHQKFQASIQINDEPVQIADKNLLVGLFNHSYFGGGIQFVPTAKQNSHHFEVVVARDVTTKVILKAFPFILWKRCWAICM